MCYELFKLNNGYLLETIKYLPGRFYFTPYLDFIFLINYSWPRLLQYVLNYIITKLSLHSKFKFNRKMSQHKFLEEKLKVKVWSTTVCWSYIFHFLRISKAKKKKISTIFFIFLQKIWKSSKAENGPIIIWIHYVLQLKFLKFILISRWIVSWCGLRIYLSSDCIGTPSLKGNDDFWNFSQNLLTKNKKMYLLTVVVICKSNAERTIKLLFTLKTRKFQN